MSWLPNINSWHSCCQCQPIYHSIIPKVQKEPPKVDAPKRKGLLLRALPILWIRQDRHFYFHKLSWVLSLSNIVTNCYPLFILDIFALTLHLWYIKAPFPLYHTYHLRLMKKILQHTDYYLFDNKGIPCLILFCR